MLHCSYGFFNYGNIAKCSVSKCLCILPLDIFKIWEDFCHIVKHIYIRSTFSSVGWGFDTRPWQTFVRWKKLFVPIALLSLDSCVESPLIYLFHFCFFNQYISSKAFYKVLYNNVLPVSMYRSTGLYKGQSI